MFNLPLFERYMRLGLGDDLNDHANINGPKKRSVLPRLDRGIQLAPGSAAKMDRPIKSGEDGLGIGQNFLLGAIIQANLRASCHPLPMSEDKTSSGLLALVVGTLRVAAPDLLPSTPVMPDCAFATASAPLMRDLLTKSLNRHGPDFILSMGQGIKQVGFEPLLYVLQQSASPAILFAKWQRFEQFTHSRHRTVLESEDEGSLTLRRLATSGPAPSTGENLLIAGLLVALTEQIGGQGVTLSWAKGKAGAATFTLSWSALGARAQQQRRPRGLATSREPLIHYGLDEQSPAARRVVALIKADISRDWSLSELGERLALSPRSLQRRLSEENTSLSAIIRSLRIREACHLLGQSDLTLTEIGYWCGFSDSPHFSREFRRSLAMPPSVYRKTASELSVTS